MRNALIVILTIFACYGILANFGVFEVAMFHKKQASEIAQSHKKDKKRQFEVRKLALYEGTINLFRGLFMGASTYEKHIYYINRLELNSNVLNRPLSPEELRGKYVFSMLVSLLGVPMMILSPIFLALPVIFIVRFSIYHVRLNTKIRDEDKIIDDYFIDLFLLLYSKLKQGSRARLQGTVENYIETLNFSYNMDAEVKPVMLKLSRYFLNLLALYGEDHVAVPKLRDTYHSATIINFCNVASQALSGVDNADNLLTFRMQLVARKEEVMRKRSNKLVQSGQRSIYAIYIILVIFIIVGWYSKLPKGMF